MQLKLPLGLCLRPRPKLFQKFWTFEQVWWPSQNATNAASPQTSSTTTTTTTRLKWANFWQTWYLVKTSGRNQTQVESSTKNVLVIKVCFSKRVLLPVLGSHQAELWPDGRSWNFSCSHQFHPWTFERLHGSFEFDQAPEELSDESTFCLSLGPWSTKTGLWKCLHL